MRIRIIIAFIILCGCRTGLDDIEASSAGEFSDVGTDVVITAASSSLSASDFEQTCADDSECLLVAEGDICECAPCENAAVSTSAFEDYETQRLGVVCEDPISAQILCSQDCPRVVSACDQNRCTAREQNFVEQDRYDNTCDSDSDCVLIYLGEVCSVCRCETAAIRMDELEKYQIDTRAGCTPPDTTCDCEQATQVACEANRCVVLP